MANAEKDKQASEAVEDDDDEPDDWYARPILVFSLSAPTDSLRDKRIFSTGCSGTL